MVRFYIDLVCKHGAKPRKIAVKCSSHHRQGISLSTDRKPRIDFEKLAARIYFVVVTQKKAFCESKRLFSMMFAFGK